MSEYWHWLIATSLLVGLLERVSPWRAQQRVMRRGLVQDIFYLGFNGHVVGLALAWVALDLPLPKTDWATGLPGYAQFLLVLVGLDLIQWCIHNLLHRVPFLWQIHKVHHSIIDLDWIGSFRFHWGEIVVYRAVQYVPLALMGFDPGVLLVHAVAGTLIGHLNHANLDWDYGPFRYLLNNPRMHIWHHAWDEVPPAGANFGIILSCWDWLFGTAWMPAHRGRAPDRLGFEGLQHFPDGLLRQLALPLGAQRPSDDDPQTPTSSLFE